MSINKLSHLKEGDKIYLEVTRELNRDEDEDGLYFDSPCTASIWISDDDPFYTLEELKQLTNDGMPKQGEMIEVRYTTSIGMLSSWFLFAFVGIYKGKILVDNGEKILRYDEWRYPIKKTELTLAEVEEKLGMEKGSLIIK